MPKYKRYDKSFKKQAVELAISSEQPIHKTAKDLGIQETTLYSWVSNAKTKDNPAPTQELDVNKMHEELLKLRKENQRLKDTCDILKKATAYFANDTKKDTHS
jgi:transposase